MDVLTIAKACHDANARYCHLIGDDTQVSWEEAPKWQRDSAVSGVEFLMMHRLAGPSDTHAKWVADKRVDGWTYGETKDPVAKTHPCMVAYDALPLEQRTKDAIFCAIVRTLGGLLPT